MAPVAGTTADLKGDRDELTEVEALHRFPERDDLADELVTEREGAEHRERRQAADRRSVQIAGGHHHRPHQRLGGRPEPRLFHLLPLESPRLDESELAHFSPSRS